jgi:hypothetical protein
MCTVVLAVGLESKAFGKMVISIRLLASKLFLAKLVMDRVLIRIYIQQIAKSVAQKLYIQEARAFLRDFANHVRN